MQNGSNNKSHNYKYSSAGARPNPAAGTEARQSSPRQIRPSQNPTQSAPRQSGSAQNPTQSAPRQGGSAQTQSAPRQSVPSKNPTQSAPRQGVQSQNSTQSAPRQSGSAQTPTQYAPRQGGSAQTPTQSAPRQGRLSQSPSQSSPRRNRTDEAPQARHAGAVSVGRAAVPVKKESSLRFLKRTFAVDKTVFEQRAIVREQGSYDYIFLILVLVLLAFGTVMVYSSSYAYSMNKYGDSYYIIFRQAVFIVVGLIGMGVAMWFRPEWYKKFALPIYIVCFFMMSLVPIPGIGVEHKGARRWISLGFTEIQPSEFMKLGLVFMLAWYMDRYYERVTDYKHLGRSSFFGIFVPFTIIGTTCLLVIIEKHLSGTIIMFLIGLIVIFAGGASIKILASLGGIGGLGLLAFALLTDYTKRRFDIWLNPEAHPRDGGWQTLQGLYAIGSGGFFGVGLGESRQKHLFVSEPQNDFIFTIVCEELGFVGAIAVILLFILFIYRGFVIAMKAPDTFSSLMVIGIVGKVATQAVLNIAVVTNSIPNTGISLPFFSYGGSSLVILMLEMGIVLSISRFSKQRR